MAAIWHIYCRRRRSHALAKCDSNTYTCPDPDADSELNSPAYRDTSTNQDTYPHSHTNAYTHYDPYKGPLPISHTNSQTHSVADSNAYTDYSFSHTLPDPYANSNARAIIGRRDVLSTFLLPGQFFYVN